jgi:hypothetical protein
MTRLQALEAVAEAARSALYVSPGAIVRLADALDALDALPADPAPAEVVEVRPIQIATHYDPGMRGYDGCGITAAYDVTTVLMSDGAFWRMWGNEPDAVWVRMPRLPLTGDGV